MSDLNNIFSLTNCLSRQQLVHYIQQKLDRDEVYLVENHLNDCPFCSDAIDGLMDTEVTQMQTILEEIKPALIQSQIEFAAIKNTNTETTKLTISSAKNRWLVAASILLLFGLGGYSVYSFMRHQSHDLAKNEEPKSIPTQTTYTETSTPRNTEIVQISVPEEEIKKLDEKPASQGPKIDIGKKMVSQVIQEKVAETNANISEDAIKQTKTETEPLIESQNYHDNFAQKESKAEAEAVHEKDLAIKRRTSVVGMSTKKNIPQIQNNAANQLNYSSDNNNYNSYNNSNNLQFTPTSVNNFENGVICYNKADYRNAINYLEIALEDANASKQEDIEYYMAMSYQKMGREKKAEKIFKKLMVSSKYKSIISDKLIKTKK
jgi:hypothetical protein